MTGLVSRGSELPQSVVIVDDQYSSVEMLAGIVSTLPGAPRVKSFTDPLEALAYVQQRQQDLILLDHQMPGMTGLQFLRNVRAFPAYRNVPVVMVTVDDDRKVCVDALEAGATDFLKKPVDPIECKARCANLLAARRDRQEVEEFRRAAEFKLQQHITAQLGRETRNAKECVFWTATVIDHYAGKADSGHLLRMGHYSGLIAQALGFNEPDVMDIVAAANLHDIGVICVPQHIMRKDTLYTADERLAMQKHCAFGAHLLGSLPNDFAEVAEVVAGAHHERLDGSGYPRGLSGGDIPRAAQIVGLADVLDALTTANALRPAKTLTAALECLQTMRGVHFAEDCVDALIMRRAELEAIVPALRQQGKA